MNKILDIVLTLVSLIPAGIILLLVYLAVWHMNKVYDFEDHWRESQ